MAIEEIDTFRINEGEDKYKTTNAKITVYKLKKTGIELTEENLKDQEVLSQVSYNRDEDNNENNKKAWNRILGLKILVLRRSKYIDLDSTVGSWKTNFVIVDLCDNIWAIDTLWCLIYEYIQWF